MYDISTLLTNRAVMSRRVWEQTLGLDEVPETWRGVLRCVVGVSSVDKQCKRGTLIAAVQLTNGGKTTASITQIDETEEAGLIRQIPDPEDARKKLYILEDKVADRLRKINEMETRISIALAKQASSPNDLNAGKSDVPDEIYFNFSDPRSSNWMRERVTEIEIRNTNAKKGDRAVGLPQQDSEH